MPANRFGQPPVHGLTVERTVVEVLHRFDPPWIKAGRVYRQMCLLRLEGRDDDARRVMDAESSLKTFLAGEGERMAMAVALAEVLVPELSQRLAGLGGARSRAAPVPEKAFARARAGEATIADYIDEMLAMERASRR
jgi:hypothetical protein